MTRNIGENIRNFRREMGLTQEQLAEAMGVTVGAVSKWESGQSNPDIAMLPRLADFFETSIDVLMGYTLRGRTAESAVARIRTLQNERRLDEGAAEAEKALQRFPNCFDVVYASAELFVRKGVEQGNQEELRRSLVLYEKSLLLLSQNTDPQVGEITIRNDIAETHLLLGEWEKAVELLKRNNHGGINNALIGYVLATEARDEEALGYLSKALARTIQELIRIGFGYVNAYRGKRDHESALDILLWQLDVFAGLKKPGVNSFLDKGAAVLLATCAELSLRMDNREAARRFLRRAKDTAEAFDAAPDYSTKNVRYFHGEGGSSYDDMGATAMEAVEKAVRDEESPELAEVWEEIKREG